MFSSIKQKLTLIYIILIILPLLAINYLSLHHMKESVLGEIEVNTLKTANILSNISRNNIQDPLALKKVTQQYGETVEGRVLILDKAGRVMVDTSHLLEGRTINNPEVRSALAMEEGVGYYQRDKYILQVTVPILQMVQGDRNLLGAVLVSVSVDDAFEAIQDFRQRLTMVSIGAAAIGVIVAILASRRMAKPIVILSNTAKRIGEGHLGEMVNIKSRDEIGRLAEDFNYMSKELYRIDHGRTQFIGDVSHELKTPLASMKALIDSLLYGEDDLEVYKEYLRDMDGEIDRLSDLVKSLLTLTRMEEQGIKMRIYSLKEIIENAVKILQPLAEKGGVEVSIALEGSPEVVCDGERMKEVFINLIDNALKYRDMEKEKYRVSIIGKRQKDDYKVMLVDNGIGIKEEELESIFEKFYRTDTSRSRDTGGAGIGLSIVSRVIQLHGWKISVASRIKEGTTVTILIPKNFLKISS
ncbi:sensor histidine kinase [Natronincola ferrireducens]|uniref:histidine kinase n=1 Tax=Natronincola ferrireducens TaxID=393762 RepID=A0A1G8XKZ9_9FIRM|nr:HAMP domain-containing sensor histidine kinase [Natronincola ferrireducens]SDJ90450.1 Signal transduction histidine kinase [Natronincola ferrireducens]